MPEDKDLLSRTGTYLTANDETFAGVSAGNAFDRIGTSATNVIDSDNATGGVRMGIGDAPELIGNRADTTVENIDDYDDNSPLKWVLPLIILALLVILGFWFCGNSEKHTAKSIITDRQ